MPREAYKLHKNKNDYILAFAWTAKGWRLVAKVYTDRGRWKSTLADQYFFFWDYPSIGGENYYFN